LFIARDTVAVDTPATSATLRRPTPRGAFEPPFRCRLTVVVLLKGWMIDGPQRARQTACNRLQFEPAFVKLAALDFRRVEP
jgi:hypothetical protein